MFDPGSDFHSYWRINDIYIRVGWVNLKLTLVRLDALCLTSLALRSFEAVPEATLSARDSCQAALDFVTA